MSSINQILNSALMETVDELKEDTTSDSLNSFNTDELKKGVKKAVNIIKDSTTKSLGTDLNPDTKTPTSVSAPDPGKFAGPPDSSDTNKTDWGKVGKYSGMSLAALGAGLGAVALAKKLRAKKSAVKAKK